MGSGRGKRSAPTRGGGGRRRRVGDDGGGAGARRSLAVGGMAVDVSDSGRVLAVSRRGAGGRGCARGGARRARDDAPGPSDADAADYMACADGDDAMDMVTAAVAVVDPDALGAGPRVESARGGSTDTGGARSSASTSSGSDSGWASSDDGGAAVAAALAGASLAERWPVAARRAPPRAARAPRPADALAPLAPGEKGKARKARVDARRAARAAARGFDARAAAAALAAFASRAAADGAAPGDLHAFPPLPTAAASRLVKLATLFGVKATLQGSGKRRLVVCAATPRTAPPSGPARARLDEMLAWHDDAAELAGASVAVGAARLRGADPRAVAAAAAAAAAARPRSGRRAADRLAVSDAPMAFVPAGAPRPPSPAPASPPGSPPASPPPAPPPAPAWPPRDAAVPLCLSTAGQVKAAKKKGAKLERRAARAAAGAPPPPPPPPPASFAAFEAHTRGVASRLMERMGFAGEGAGLGARGQGRTEPLAAAARPRRAGLGT